MNGNRPHIAKFFIPKDSKYGLILDRDNTLVKDNGYVHRVEEIEFIPSAIDFLLTAKNYKVQMHIATNQGGVALGVYTAEQSQEFNSCVVSRLRELGIHINSVLSCYHHPEAPRQEYRACECRKPSPGLVASILDDNSLEAHNCLVIGDSQADILAAERVGVESVFLSNESSWELAKEWLKNRCY